MLGAAAGIALATLPACSADEPPPQSVGWIDAFCGSIAGYAAISAPAGNHADPVAAVEEYRRWATQTEAALDAALTEIARVGASPIEGGDGLVAQTTDRLGRYRDRFAEAAARLEEVDPGEGNVAEAVEEALAPLQDLGAAPTVDLDPATPLGQAAENAPNCRQIRTAES